GTHQPDATVELGGAVGPGGAAGPGGVVGLGGAAGPGGAVGPGGGAPRQVGPRRRGAVHAAGRAGFRAGGLRRQGRPILCGPVSVLASSSSPAVNELRTWSYIEFPILSGSGSVSVPGS